MINRVDRKKIEMLPRAAKSDGLMCCPYCWHPLAEPIKGKATLAIWCRTCKRHVILETD